MPEARSANVDFHQDEAVLELQTTDLVAHRAAFFRTYALALWLSSRSTSGDRSRAISAEQMLPSAVSASPVMCCVRRNSLLYRSEALVQLQVPAVIQFQLELQSRSLVPAGAQSRVSSTMPG